MPKSIVGESRESEGRSAEPPLQESGDHMPRAKTIQFLVDERGRKTSVLMSYRAYREMMEFMEDLDDLRVKMERSEETPEDFKRVLEDLRHADRV